MALGRPVSSLVELEIGNRDCQTKDRSGMASSGLQALLDLEEPRLGRPNIPPEVRELIRSMSRTNLLWGAPRLHSELLKLGIDVSQATVAKYMVRRHGPPSQTWRTFLHNHISQLVSVDFFTVPTLSFEILFVFVVLAHQRRRIVHFNVTTHPTAEWASQQLLEAFPFDTAPKYLLRDRDRIYGDQFRRQIRDIGIQEVLGAPYSPWQRAYVERVIVPYAGSAWTMYLSSANTLCAVCFTPTSATTTNRDFICRWRRIRRIHARYSRSEKSSQLRRSADCTTDMIARAA